MAVRAQVVQLAFEDRQTTTEKALAELMAEIEKDKQRRKDQAEKGLDHVSYFVLCKMTEDNIPNAEQVSKKISEAFGKYPGWKESDAAMRELRKAVTMAIYAEEDDLDRVAATVESLFVLLERAFRK
jgi:type I restriction enzyme R subunit